MDIKSTREEFARIHEEAKVLVEKQGTAELSAEETTALADKYAAMDKMEKQIMDAEKLAKYSFEKPEAKDASKVIVSKSAEKAAYEASDKVAAITSKNIDREDFGKALTNWALTGEMDEKYANITTATNSSSLLPTVVANPIVPVAGNRLRLGMSRVGVTPLTTPGTATFNVPVVLTALGTALSETGTGVENGTDGSAIINNIPLAVSAFQSGQVWVSNLELAANDYDLLSAVIPGLDDAKELKLESTIFAAIAADSNITQSVTLSGITASTALSGTSGYNSLVAANRKMTTRFDRLKVIFLSNDAFAAAEGLIGSDGHPVLSIDPQNQGLYSFNGTPVIKTDYLSTFGANNVVGVVISFVGFRLRDAGGAAKIIRYTNVPTRDDATGLNEVGYHAFGYIPQAIVKIKCSAS